MCQISFAQPRGSPLRAACAVIRSSRSLDNPFVGTPAMRDETTEMVGRLQPVVNAFDDASALGFGPSLIASDSTLTCLPSMRALHRPSTRRPCRNAAAARPQRKSPISITADHRHKSSRQTKEFWMLAFAESSVLVDTANSAPFGISRPPKPKPTTMRPLRTSVWSQD